VRAGWKTWRAGSISHELSFTSWEGATRGHATGIPDQGLAPPSTVSRNFVRDSNIAARIAPVEERGTKAGRDRFESKQLGERNDTFPAGPTDRDGLGCRTSAGGSDRARSRFKSSFRRRFLAAATQPEAVRRTIGTSHAMQANRPGTKATSGGRIENQARDTSDPAAYDIAKGAFHPTNPR